MSPTDSARVSTQLLAVAFVEPLGLGLVQGAEEGAYGHIEAGSFIRPNGVRSGVFDLQRIDPLATMFERKVQVGTRGASSFAHVSDNRTLVHLVADYDAPELVQMGIVAGVPTGMFDDDLIAGGTLASHKFDRTRCHRLHGGIDGGGVIDGQVALPSVEYRMKSSMRESRRNPRVFQGRLQELLLEGASFFCVIGLLATTVLVQKRGKVAKLAFVSGRLNLAILKEAPIDVDLVNNDANHIALMDLLEEVHVKRKQFADSLGQLWALSTTRDAREEGGINGASKCKKTTINGDVLFDREVFATLKFHLVHVHWAGYIAK